MSYLLRVVLPDRPGSLGGVAAAIGAAGGDIVGVDVVEHRADGRAVDDFLVDLPSGKLPDALVSACRSVEGVAVEFVGHYSPGAHLHRDLEAVEAMTGDPDRTAEILVDLVPGVFRSGWALLVSLDDGKVKVERAAAGAPEADGYAAPWLPMPGPVRIGTGDGWAPDSWQDVVAVGTPLESGHRAIVFGRDGGPRILDSELARLTHLAALATVIRRDGVTGRDSG
ncbi:amino acid-binding protein [Phytoactinopolyspora alkaliphila]|uniref:Amino acid-binding protein n=1 Tax=Phytoactinopolyspora alkaliphila TaxID=1783498 RepID=A0A6N9YQV0_9ACTN|nr:ACT domain-containing protein [Phytoactinopolyspora alkaliphila]NED97362.1 amino acid-binding protein [Phytoactinopolyspora alkaliphila]